MRTALRAVLIAVGAIAAVAIAFFLWFVTAPGPFDFAGGKKVVLSDYHAPDPTGVPASLAHASQVARGEYLARAADCTSCHTAKGGAPFAGGLAFHLPFGTIYSANI